MIYPVNFITDFADQAVVLPMVAAIALVLFLQGWRRGALAWLAVAAVTFSAVLVLKLSFLACEPVFAPWTLQSPSGHTAAAAVVAGGLAALLTGSRRVVLMVAILAAAVIGASRLWLGLHSPSEVILGAVLGIAGAAMIPRLTAHSRVRRPVSLLAVAGVVAVTLHGVRLPAEEVIRETSRGALGFVPACRVAEATPWRIAQDRP